jgi:hypothetical protein
MSLLRRRLRGSGGWLATVFPVLALFPTAVLGQGGTLANGALQTATLASGASDSWTFSANAGDNIYLRVGAANFSPRIQLFGADNAPLQDIKSANGFVHDVWLTAQAASSGTYTVLVSSTFAGSGSYSVSLGEALEPIVVSSGDEGGPMQNGAANTGTIALGDIDVWSFTAKAGDSLMLRMGSAAMSPWIQLYGPSGALVQDAKSVNGFTHDVWMTLQATNSGSYTVMVSSTFAGGVGDYTLTLAQAPESFIVSPNDQGGPMQNGASNAGTITLGDADMWSFTANAGDNFMLRAGSADMSPWFIVYGPDGALVQDVKSVNGFTHDVWTTLQATNSGTYTVVVSSTFAGGIGDYTLTLAQAPESFIVSPNDQGGPMQNGASNAGTITLGDADMWSFTANAGDRLVLRAGSANMSPWFLVYGPDGALVEDIKSVNGFTHDIWTTLQATNTGTYTVVVSSTFAGGIGDYTLTLAQAPEPFITSPGDEGGALTNGIPAAGTISLGDLDMWSFQAKAGDGLMLRAGAANMSPWIQLYGPTGALVQEVTSVNGFTHDVWMSLQATNAGTYTVVISSTFPGGVGDYSLFLGQALEPIVVQPGTAGGPLTNGVTNSATLNLGGMSFWSYYGTPGDSNVLRAASADFSPWLLLWGPDGKLLQDVKSVNGFTHSITLSQVITNAGTYTVGLGSTFANGLGAYTLKESRVPPDLVVPDTQTLDEGNTLNVSISAQDPDAPTKPLVFNLLSGPAALKLALAGATNATLTWATTEADGPSTNQVVVTVTDTVNGHAFIRTNSFTVVVNEINTPPKLTVPASQTLDELTPLNVSASATDADLPPNPLTFSLISQPAGMQIDPNSGAITWTPSEAQGPGTYTITVVVTDFSSSAVNAQHLSDTNSFTVTVNEINTPPQLTVPANQRINELTPLNVSASATDSDLPLNPLTFSLVNPPSGMIIDPNTGAISWTPTEAQGPSTNTITVTVTDSNPAAVNSQHLSVTGSFIVIVDEVNTPPQLTVPANQVLNGLVPLQVSASATDSDIPANPLTFSLVSPPPGMQIDPNTGAISWTPMAAQAPSTNVVTVVVTDFNAAAINQQHLSATNSFTVVVHANTPPVLQSIANQSGHFGTPLTVQASASDADLPAQTLTFSLDQAPTNMTINATSGLISWTPVEAQIGDSTVTVRVTDNGVPPMFATTTFKVSVSGAEWSLALQPLAGGLMQITIIGDTTFSYELDGSTDLKTWTKLVQQTGPKFIDPDSATVPIRFYRLKLIQP